MAAGEYSFVRHGQAFHVRYPFSKESLLLESEMGMVPQDSLSGLRVWASEHDPLQSELEHTYVYRPTQITRKRMRKGDLWHREGRRHHLRLLSTGIGEFSIKVTLDDSQTILLSLPVSYDGDDQSRCHEVGENQIPIYIGALWRD
jgi:hypothetical protein